MGIETLISTSDAIDTSIFCRKLEMARPMREKVDGKRVDFLPELAFLLRFSIM